MSEDRHRGKYIPFRCSSSTEEQITRISAETHRPKSEVLRMLVDQGLAATGYKQDEEYLRGVIQETVQAVMKPQIERLAAISAKATHIGAAAFFMGIYASRLMLPEAESRFVDEMAAQARKLGVEYLKLRNRDVDDFIQSAAQKMK